MKFLWFMIFSVVAILIKENFCVPAIRPLSQRGIIFPVDNWDDCFLDEDSKQPGSCKKLQECPELLKKWDKEDVYPKTCYFIKKAQFVCCPIAATKEMFTSTEKLENIFNKSTTIAADKLDDIISGVFNIEPEIVSLNPESKDANAINNRPSNIFLDKVKNKTTTTTTTSISTSTKRPSNIFLDKVKNKTTTTTTSTKRPSNIFLENLNTPSTIKEKSPFDIFVTEQTSFIKRRSEAECDLQNPQKFHSIDINGPTSEPNEFPFMAVLGWKSEIDSKVWYPCGGILISPRFVLTAAHCADIGGVKPSFVRLGDKNLTESEEDTINIKQFIIHPSYNEKAINNNIALVELEQEVYNPMACLWIHRDLPITKFIALGYGHISFETASSNQLFKAALTAIDNLECQEIYKLDEKLRHMEIFDTHLCAGDVENFRHFCQGDTGGPLIVALDRVIYVVGITSFGLGCADLPPSIFTRVSSFIDWIEPIVWPEIDVRIDSI